MNKRTLALVVALALAVVGGTRRARADGPLGPDGSRIETSTYTVDLAHGLVLDGSRPTGLGGAYVAIAEGVDGMLQNPASPAHRLPYSFSDVDYDLGLGVTFPTTVASADYFNSGRRTTEVGMQSEREQFLFVNLAGLLQWSDWGVGAAFDLQNYGLRRTVDPTLGAETSRLYARFLTGRMQLARRLDDLVVGGGIRLVALSVVDRQSDVAEERELFSRTGWGLEAGMLWRPEGLPFRVGASVHSGVTTEAAEGGRTTLEVSGDRIIPDPDDPTNPAAPNAIYLPGKLTQPWGVNVGVAVQFGPRPFNPRWVNPDRVLSSLHRYLEWRRLERQRRRNADLYRIQQQGGDVKAARAALDAELETAGQLDRAHWQREQERVDQQLRSRYRALERFHVLISASLVITGAVEAGVGVESFLQQRVARSGERVAYSPRLGIESEVVPAWLRVRGGTYLEPTRFSTEGAAARLHTTLGMDVRLFPWTVFALFPEHTSWRVGGMLDAAPRYLGWGLSVGVWH